MERLRRQGKKQKWPGTGRFRKRLKNRMLEGKRMSWLRRGGLCDRCRQKAIIGDMGEGGESNLRSKQ